MGSQTYFTNNAGGGSGSGDYVKDAFSDISLSATDNAGYTSNSQTNPLGRSFANDDSVRLRQKTLYIKDLVLIEDRTKWISNKPTYQIIWNESWPAAFGYVFGNIALGTKIGQNYVTFKTGLDGIGVTGNIRRIAFLTEDSTASSASGQLVIDGVNADVVDFSNLDPDAEAQPHGRISGQFTSSNQTNDIHDFRMTAVQSNTLRFKGVILYYENSGNNVQVQPGVTYIDKTKVTTSTGATFALPSFGSSLGGVALVYKTRASSYAMANMTAETVTSVASGSNGSNLLAVSTGHGSSFPQGSAIVAPQGASWYVGVVESVSTDTLTVSPNLPFALSSSNIYRSWLSGPTYVISSSFMALDFTIAPPAQQVPTFPILSGQGQYAVWGDNYGVTLVDSVESFVFRGASGFIQVDGKFSAAEIQTIGNGIFAFTASINGLPSWSASEGHTGALRKTIFTDAGPGWNSFRLSPGPSLGAIGINQINLYNRTRDLGVSFGSLAQFAANQAFTDRTPTAQASALGVAQRIYADQMYLKGAWTRFSGASFAGGVAYRGSGATSILDISYYGKDFAILGAVSGGTLFLDGTPIANTFNTMRSVATEGPHRVQYNTVSGSTTTIEAFDYVCSLGEVKSLQNLDNPYEAYPVPLEETQDIENQVSEFYAYGGAYGATAAYNAYFTNIGVWTGTAYAVDMSSTNAMAITILEDGIYGVDGTWQYAGSNTYNGVKITKNYLDIANGAVSYPPEATITWGENHPPGSASVSGYPGKSGFAYLIKGDVVRMALEANFGISDPSNTYFKIIQLQKVTRVSR